MIDVRTEIKTVCRELEELLLAKNARYGNSALDPVRVFSRADATEQLKVRIDDKLSRLARGSGVDDEDVVLDLLGYLALLRVAQRAAAAPAAAATASVEQTPAPSQSSTARREAGKKGAAARWSRRAAERADAPAAADASAMRSHATHPAPGCESHAPADASGCESHGAGDASGCESHPADASRMSADPDLSFFVSLSGSENSHTLSAGASASEGDEKPMRSDAVSMPSDAPPPPAASTQHAPECGASDAPTHASSMPSDASPPPTASTHHAPASAASDALTYASRRPANAPGVVHEFVHRASAPRPRELIRPEPPEQLKPRARPLFERLVVHRGLFSSLIDDVLAGAARDMEASTLLDARTNTMELVPLIEDAIRYAAQHAEQHVAATDTSVLLTVIRKFGFLLGDARANRRTDSSAKRSPPRGPTPPMPSSDDFAQSEVRAMEETLGRHRGPRRTTGEATGRELFAPRLPTGTGGAP